MPESVESGQQDRVTATAALPEGHVAVEWSDLHWLIAMAEPNVPDGHWRLDRLRDALGWAGRIQE
jgi:hypothetical protein